MATDEPPYRFESYAGDVLELGEGWDLVLGHSLGGAVSIVAQTMRPTFTRRLVLEDPWLVVSETDADWLLQQFEGDLDPEGILEANPSWDPRDAREKAIALRRCGPEVVERTVADNAPRRLLASVERLAVPTLLLGSDPRLQTLVPPGLGARLAAANPALTYRMVEGAGHSIHRDSYDVFWEEVAGVTTESA